jgi:hypothetical protein
MAGMSESRAPYAARGNARPVTRQDVDSALARLESRSVEDANLLRAYLDMLEGLVRLYQLGDDAIPDDELPGWGGALE